MRILNILLALGLTIGLLSAQQQGKGKGAPPAPKEYTSAAEIQAMIAKSKNDRKDGQAIVNSAILRLAPYAANMEYRASGGPAAVHETEAEMFYVIDGTATMVLSPDSDFFRYFRDQRGTDSQGQRPPAAAPAPR